jgi:hypothetical protein
LKNSRINMGSKKEKEKITLDTIVQRDPEQEFTKIDDEVVMLSLKNGEYYALNSVASRIWEIIENEINTEKITEILIEEFDVDKKVCLDETLNCLIEFKDKSLLKSK